MGTEPPPSQVSCVAAWTEARTWVLLGWRKEESAKQVPVEEGNTPGECSAG